MWNFIKAASCKVGIHDWTIWDYQFPDKCIQTCKCNRCSKTDKREEHTFSNWEYIDLQSCNQTRTCQRCSLSESRVKHDMPDVGDYESPTSCQKVKICKHCLVFQENGPIDHVYSAWTYTNTNSCDQVRTCQRCSSSESRVKHDLGEWEYESLRSCQKVKICKHCHVVQQIGSIEHRYSGMWEYKDQNSCNQEKICSRCSSSFEYRTEHRWGSFDYESPTSCQQVRYCLRCHQMDKGDITHRQWQKISKHEHKCGRCGKTELSIFHRA